jgi:hypothetical protein
MSKEEMLVDKMSKEEMLVDNMSKEEMLVDKMYANVCRRIYVATLDAYQGDQIGRNFTQLVIVYKLWAAY